MTIATARRVFGIAGFVAYVAMAIAAVRLFRDWSMVTCFVGFLLGFVAGYTDHPTPRREP